MTIEERAKVWIKSKDTASMILSCGGVSGAAKSIYIAGATEQSEIDVKVAARCICENCYKDCEFAQCTDEECMLQCPILIDLCNKMKGE